VVGRGEAGFLIVVGAIEGEGKGGKGERRRRKGIAIVSLSECPARGERRENEETYTGE
jgi:hypothetical protein